MKAFRCQRFIGSRQCARPAGHAPGCALIPARGEVLAITSSAEVEVPNLLPAPIVALRCRLYVGGLQCARPRRHGDDCSATPGRDEVLRVLTSDTILVPRKEAKP